MKKINYKSDFDFILKLTDCKGEDIGWPDYAWKARLWTGVKANAYEVSCMGGEPSNCFNDEGQIHVVVNNHRMGPGQLNIEFTALLPDEIYPDGDERIVVPAPLGIELVRGAAACPSAVEVEAMLPYIKGEPFTYTDFTPEQIAELQRPATEAAAKADALSMEQATHTWFVSSCESEREEPDKFTTYISGPLVDAMTQANINAGVIKAEDNVCFDNMCRLEGLLLAPALSKLKYIDIMEVQGMPSVVFEIAVRGASPGNNMAGTTYDLNVSGQVVKGRRAKIVDVRITSGSPFDYMEMMSTGRVPQPGNWYFHAIRDQFVVTRSAKSRYTQTLICDGQSYSCRSVYHVQGIGYEGGTLTGYYLKFSDDAHRILDDGTIDENAEIIQVLETDVISQKDTVMRSHIQVRQNSASDGDITETGEWLAVIPEAVEASYVSFESYDGKIYPEKPYDYKTVRGSGYSTVVTYHWVFGDFDYQKESYPA